MKIQISKIRAQSNIKKIKKQLDELESEEAQARPDPQEHSNDTYLIRNFAEEKRRLLAELEKNEKIAKG